MFRCGANNHGRDCDGEITCESIFCCVLNKGDSCFELLGGGGGGGGGGGRAMQRFSSVYECFKEIFFAYVALILMPILMQEWV